MIRFYYHPTPNPAKVALFLEETGLPYEIVPVDTAKGQQHTPEFRAVNPNGKVPAIVDTEGQAARRGYSTQPRSCFISAKRPAS
jgi:GST-like protein